MKIYFKEVYKIILVLNMDETILLLIVIILSFIGISALTLVMNRDATD